MPMYNLLEFSDNYSMTSESLSNYYKDEIHYVVNDASEGNSFKYKTKIIGKTPARPARPAQPPLFHLDILVIFGDLSICL